MSPCRLPPPTSVTLQGDARLREPCHAPGSLVSRKAEDKPTGKVLVVDDDEDLRALLARELANAGFDVTTAESASSAQALLSQGDYGVVVTDLRMPNIDGAQLSAWIREHAPSVEVVMLTAFASVDGAAAMRAGVSDYLVKHHVDLASIGEAVGAASRRHPSTRSSVRVNEQLRAELATMVHLLDRLPLGIAFVDRRGRLRIANAIVRSILQAQDGLGLEADGRIRTTSRSANGALAALLDGASASRCQGAAWTCERPSGALPLRVALVPLDMRAGADGPVAVLLVHDPSRPHSAPESVLQQVYGLTPAEASLAAVMMQGCPIERAAEELGISVNTAKTHMKRVFCKTGVCRQAELVYLFLTGPALLSAGR